jgi:putative peptidoglycan lipid II flippase
MTEKRSIARTTLLLVPLQIVFRAGEAALPLLLATWFGRTTLTDVYYFSWAVFALAGSLVFSAYQDSAVVPVLAEVRLRDRVSLPFVVGSLLAHTLLLGGLLALGIGVVSLGWFSVRYSGAELRAAAWMVAPFCAYLVALSVKTFFFTMLNSEHKYFAQPVASSLGIVTTLGTIYLGKGTLGIVAIPVGQLAGEVVAIAAVAWLALRIVEIKIVLNLSRPDPVLRFARLIASEVGGAAVTRINPVVDQLMAGMAGVVGGGTLLRLTGDVASLPTSLLQATLLPVLVSHLADDFAAGRIDKIRATVTRSVGVVLGVLFAATLLLYFARAPLLRFVFLRGEMDPRGVERMIHLLQFHLVGLAAFGALLILVRAHVAVKNSGIMVGMGVLNASLNAIFNVVFMKALGLEGIALSTSCVQIAVAIVFWIRLESKLASLREARA